MTLDKFWSMVAKVHRDADGDMDTKCQLLAEELRKLPPAEVQSFSEHFDSCSDQAYAWELWAAAYIIGGGCSDDAFSDFRATLISLGRETFERVLANPDALTDMDVDEENAFYEGYQYPVIEVYKGQTGDLPRRTTPHPDSPSGTPWDEDTVAQLYPRLAARHGFRS